ncbi:MAG: CDP-diacylglycerol--serine O-phosphatidyltransferase [Calditrichia bacterium]
MRVKSSIVPNFFTMANMFCGFYSVVMAAQAGSGNRGAFIWAAWLIIAAAVLDVLDGKLARLTKSSSSFGVQYDSLADVVSFGFAPAFLAYKVFFFKWGFIGLLLSFMPLVFGSIRLARFNIRLSGFDKEYFEGLPIPAAAVTIASFVIFNFRFWDTLRWSKLYLVLLIFLSLMMISLIRYEKVPNFTLQADAKTRMKIILVLLGVVIIIFSPEETFFPIAILYCFSGPVKALLVILNPNRQKRTNEIMDDSE